jgi:putative restriction endonuclease
MGRAKQGALLAMSVAIYAEKFSRLAVDLAHGRASPHKICMLLAVLDLARGGGLTENRIRYEPMLLERYRRFFDAVRTKRDHPNPYLPFFHLAGDLRGGEKSFWALKAVAGREAVLADMLKPGAKRKARKAKAITDNIDHAELDSALFALLQDPAAIDALTDSLARHWFGRGLEGLTTEVGRSAAVSRYERRLRSRELTLAVTDVPPDPYIRDPAFRRVVIQAYDYRCAATGVRVVLPSGEAMVEAAHIQPFSVAGDDDPRNGLALTPDMHWAMDKDLIAPGPDLKWHVSKALDSRIPDFRALCELAGRPLILPNVERLRPKPESLDWKWQKLKSVP